PAPGHPARADGSRLGRVPARNRRDLELRVVLPMSGRAPIVGPALELDDLDLLPAALVQHLALDLAARDDRGADANVRPVADEQHLIEVDDVSDLGIQALDAQLVAGAHAVLFTACTKNRIHWEKLLGIRSGAGPQEATHFSECSEGGQRDRPRGRGARSRSRPPPKGPAAPCRSVRSPALSPALAKAAHLRHHLLNAC